MKTSVILLLAIIGLAVRLLPQPALAAPASVAAFNDAQQSSAMILDHHNPLSDPANHGDRNDYGTVFWTTTGGVLTLLMAIACAILLAGWDTSGSPGPFRPFSSQLTDQTTRENSPANRSVSTHTTNAH